MKPVDSLGELHRLRDASSPALTSALQGLAARGPDASELASLAGRLALQGVPMNGPAPAPRGASATPVAGWKLALAGTAATVGVGAWLLWGTPPSEHLPRAQPAEIGFVAPPASSQSAPQLQQANGAPPTVASAVGTQRRAPEPGDAPAAAPSVTTLPEPAALNAAPHTAALVQPQTNLVQPQTNLVQPQTTADLAAHEPAPATRSPSADPGPGSLATATSTGTANAPSELELLRGARLALKSSPAEALRLAEQHRSSYPTGKLSQERELIAISALAALGRRTAALVRAASFERAFPTSPYRKQIGELLQ